ncbi:MAG: alanyl-tRNA editing protein [Roseiflexaceae bacterium]|nr:alanyl-tRNA editing protein [Roseiflexaceae bacterium]
MPTERLYYGDSYLQTFSARVVARGEQAGCPTIALDQSAFYPDGGGQPADQGALNGIRVADVQVDDDGVVWHTLAHPIESDSVYGEVDWPRRFDHMQQHHGQHLLSAAFEELYGLKTTSFHLGTSFVTIDLDASIVAADQAAAVEDLTNRVIWEDRPVLARFVSPEELATLPLRKPPTVNGPVRVVSVADFDHSACGGTHPRTTGGVGLVSIRRWERRGTTTRVEFLCGGRAVHDLRHKHRVFGRLAAQLSIASDEIEPTVMRLREAEEQARKGLEHARGRLLVYEAHEWANQAVTIGEIAVVRVLSTERSLDELRTLAKLIGDHGCVAIVGMAAEKGHLIIARGAELKIDCAAVLRAALAPFGGRGGGRPELAQGGLPDPTRIAEALDMALASFAA